MPGCCSVFQCLKALLSWRRLNAVGAILAQFPELRHFYCECGAALDDLRHDEGRGGEKPMSCQRPDVLVLRMLVRPVKINPGPAMDRPLPALAV